ncbi:phage tail protein [Rhizobium tumorigenes]|uniref:Phage tail collar domain-containing protein n=1 Tax=Rhizobium tumorigenes TaxID=2041385 RepID=A0AAF1KTC6_9HYPH|nr:hypothetical protein [Rhizobium tumorigenes]WFR98723.1 hypothetical protein PR017_23775 [Rhizobium tumorigenes]
MAGFWNKSQSQIQDVNGKPMVGARAYFYKGGTTTPISVYGPYALGAVNKLPNPVVSDGNGFFPSVFFDSADEFYHVRITTAGGVIILDADGLPIIGPSGGAGGGGDNPVNPYAVATTGDLKMRFGTGFIPGWVQLNAKTIGSAISGASERANADTQPLFEYLWNNDQDLVIVGGRGSYAATDWAANKQLTLPDGRGRTLIGLDTMGNSPAGAMGGAIFLGWNGGEEKHTLIVSEMPSHSHGGVTDDAGNNTHAVSGTEAATGSNNISFRGNGGEHSQSTTAAGLHRHGVFTENVGGGLAHNNVQPSLACTIYIRL